MSLKVLTQGVQGVGGKFASIFVTGLSESGSVSATEQVPVEVPNPAIVVPDGYTQLEYIQTSGTQYIDTGVVGKSGVEVNAEIMFLAVTGDESAIGARKGSTRIYPIDIDGSKWSLGYYSNNVSSVTVSANTKYSVYSKLLVGSQALVVNGTTVVSGTNSSSYNTGFNMWAPSTNYNGASQAGQVRIYRMDISMDGTLMRDYIPAKRNSDSVLGMYDLANDVFYTNSGSGTFLAGEEIPQYIIDYVDGKTVQGEWVTKTVDETEVNGFSISPIKSYGTWMVTAINGEKIKTQNVLVDTAVEYEIEMEYILWLYKDEDQFVDTTGGWICNYNSLGMSYSFSSSGIKFTITNSQGRAGCAFPSYKIDVGPYNTLKATFSVSSVPSSEGRMYFGLSETNTSGNPYASGLVVKQAINTTGTTELSVDISEIEGEYYVAVGADIASGVVNNIRLSM